MDSPEQPILYDKNLIDIVRESIESRRNELEKLLREIYVEKLSKESKGLLAHHTIEDGSNIGFNYQLPQILSHNNPRDWKLVANTVCGPLLMMLKKIYMIASNKPYIDFRKSSCLQIEWLLSKEKPSFATTSNIQELLKITVDILNQSLQNHEPEQPLVIKNSAAKRPSFFPLDFAARGKPALATQGENSISPLGEPHRVVTAASGRVLNYKILTQGYLLEVDATTAEELINNLILGIPQQIKNLEPIQEKYKQFICN